MTSSDVFLWSIILFFCSLPQTSLSFNVQFESSKSPLLGVITEPDAVTTRRNLEKTYQTLCEVMEAEKVDLISIRCSKENKNERMCETTDGSTFEDRLVELANRLIEYRHSLQIQQQSQNQREKKLPYIVINDNIDAALKSSVDGIHVKERDFQSDETIQAIKSSIISHYKETGKRLFLGTSAHSIESAIHAYSLLSKNNAKNSIDSDDDVIELKYFFVGTCYLTKSHPEKKKTEDLEGPKLPGLVRKALLSENGGNHIKAPRIFAIGGINENNCWEPVEYGACGVAVIRSIMNADNSIQVSDQMHKRMKKEILK